jgi:hypothetical protein
MSPQRCFYCALLNVLGLALAIALMLPVAALAFLIAVPGLIAMSVWEGTTMTMGGMFMRARSVLDDMFSRLRTR